MSFIIKNCIGCGACVTACPSGFKLKDGKAVIINKIEAKKFTGCPVDAIK